MKGVEAHALPQLTDQWVFVLTRTFTFSPNDPNLGPLPAHDSVEAVRVSDRSEVTVAAFTSAVTTVSVDNLLREQFSPDGRQLVLSVVIGDPARERAALVIVDLATGTVRQLTTDAVYNDLQPAWSPTANGIAFARTRIGAGDAGIWVVDANGAIPPRQVLADDPAPGVTAVFSWTGDGTGIGFRRGFETARYSVLEVATERITQVGELFVGGRDCCDWRQGAPAFVGALEASPDKSDQSIVVADDGLGRTSRVLLTRPQQTGSDLLVRARWRPGADDILYVSVTGDAPGQPSTNEILVTPSTRAAPRSVIRAPEQILAAWTPDGARIVYFQGRGFGGIWMVRPDGSDRQGLASFGGVPEANIRQLDLAVVGY